MIYSFNEPTEVLVFLWIFLIDVVALLKPPRFLSHWPYVKKGIESFKEGDRVLDFCNSLFF